jgi:hypothetical protein
MARYLHDHSVIKIDKASKEAEIFRQPIDGGTQVAVEGIYQCECGREVAMAPNSHLPKKGHHQHEDPQHQFQWTLLVRAN